MNFYVYKCIAVKFMKENLPRIKFMKERLPSARKLEPSSREDRKMRTVLKD